MTRETAPEIRPFLLEATVFTSGAVVMILELSGSRVLGPYFGNSVYIWTSLIGIVLGSLSVGYWWGGRLADRTPSYEALSSILIAAAVLVGLTAVLKHGVMTAITSAIADLRTGAVLATIALFAAPGVLLGMVTPYAVRLKMSEVRTAGETVGRLYAVSTVGSIVGTFATGFFLLSLMGVTKLLFALAAALALLSAAVFAGRRGIKLAAAAAFVFSGFAAHRISAARAAEGFVDVDSDYSRIWIKDGRDPVSGRPIRMMLTDPYGGQSLAYTDDFDDVYAKALRFYRLAGHFRPGIRRALAVGGAGYTFPRDFLRRHPDSALTVVEIDPKLTDLARRYFALEDDPRLTIVHEDARAFLNRNTERYDALILDAFNSTFTPPFQLATVEAVRLYADALADDGVLLLNMVSSIEGDSGKFFRAQLETYKRVFPQVHVFPVYFKDDPSAWQSLILVAAKSGKELLFKSDDPEIQRYLDHRWTGPVPRGEVVLTDDFVPVEGLLLGAVAKLERGRR